MHQEETPIKLDLSVETLAILAEQQPEGPIGENTGIRKCGGSGSECSPPTCCP